MTAQAQSFAVVLGRVLITQGPKQFGVKRTLLRPAATSAFDGNEVARSSGFGERTDEDVGHSKSAIGPITIQATAVLNAKQKLTWGA
jgi:hypothetical protein